MSSWSRLGAVDQRHFVKDKPHLFHRTPTGNLELVKAKRRLLAASELIILAEGSYRQTEPRAMGRTLSIDGHNVQLRDQAPLLVKGQLELEGGFSMTDLVTLLDAHVYFWPDVGSGLSTSAKYRGEDFALIRVSTWSMFKRNGTALFCRVNSGGPRANNGRPSRRGPDLFQQASAFSGTVSKVEEVVFQKQANLPDNAEVSLDGGQTFTPLFAATP
ncbi:MAG: hypothetical protein IPJ65_28555 [Archangiaceae bacterium]|nr:hypothetical protein [Archangiaceae bacterium]